MTSINQSWVSLSISLRLSLSLSLSKVDSPDRVGKISPAGSVAVGVVGCNSDGGGSIAVVAGVGAVAGEAVAGIGVVLAWVEAVLAGGAVEHSRVRVSLSGSQGGAADHNSNPDHLS